MADDPLTTYIKFATVLVRRDRFLHQRMRELSMATPASISKLTDHAKKVATLLADSEKTAEKAGPIIENFAATLDKFKAGVSQVKERDLELSAVLKDMGNATEVIGDAFREGAGGGDKVEGEKQTAAEAGGAGGANGGAPKSG